MWGYLKAKKGIQKNPYIIRMEKMLFVVPRINHKKNNCMAAGCDHIGDISI